MHTGNNISIELETNEPPYRQHGVFRSDGDEYIRITGTVGDDIGKEILIPKSRIKRIIILD